MLLLINTGTLIVGSWVLPLVTSIGEIIVFLPYKIYLNGYYLLKTEKRHIFLRS